LLRRNNHNGQVDQRVQQSKLPLRNFKGFLHWFSPVNVMI
jgi:hypothetical protein